MGRLEDLGYLTMQERLKRRVGMAWFQIRRRSSAGRRGKRANVDGSESVGVAGRAVFSDGGFPG